MVVALVLFAFGGAYCSLYYLYDVVSFSRYFYGGIAAMTAWNPWELMSLACGLLIPICWYAIMRKVEESISDDLLNTQIKYCFACMFITAFINIFAADPGLEALSYLSSLVALVGFVFLCKIISRCTKCGDSQVKKFGIFLIVSMVVAVIFMFVGMYLTIFVSSMDYMMMLLSLIITAGVYTFAYTYPFAYFYKIINNK